MNIEAPEAVERSKVLGPESAPRREMKTDPRQRARWGWRGWVTGAATVYLVQVAALVLMYGEGRAVPVIAGSKDAEVSLRVRNGELSASELVPLLGLLMAWTNCRHQIWVSHDGVSYVWEVDAVDVLKGATLRSERKGDRITVFKDGYRASEVISFSVTTTETGL